jgi:hypothetical protein
MSELGVQQNCPNSILPMSPKKDIIINCIFNQMSGCDLAHLGIGVSILQLQQLRIMSVNFMMVNPNSFAVLDVKHFCSSKCFQHLKSKI